MEYLDTKYFMSLANIVKAHTILQWAIDTNLH